jgi:hypothetical protein
MRSIRSILSRLVRLDFVRDPAIRARMGQSPPQDFSAEDREIVERIARFTLTSFERQSALISAVRHLVRASVPGCLVECGVWRGGSAMAMALALIQEGDTGRDLWLYDTFQGMTEPAEIDHVPSQCWDWTAVDAETVQRNVASTGYPMNRVHLVQGTVEKTIPARSPKGPIALLRLDTDWYESTKHELLHLFPLVAEGGFVIVDDYGHFDGARKATDEYLARLNRLHFLHRLDYTGRLLLKLPGVSVSSECPGSGG